MTNRKQEYQRRVTKRKKKCGKRKVSTSGEDSDSLSNSSSLPAKKIKKAKRWGHHQPTSSFSSIDSHSSTNVESHMIGLKLSLKMKNLNGNYPKLWPTT